MGLFEFIGEQFSPGPTRGSELPDVPRHGSTLSVLVRVAVASALVVGALAAVWWVPETSDLDMVSYAAIALFLYVVVSTFLRPRPSLDNLGWAGGLIDNPLRYSDDINRTKLLIAVLMSPGRFIGLSFFDLLQWATSSRHRD
ncbi:MAG: hypothetical protein KC912_19805 [Proteobacteria bacterium]|nr:hypothetical protein [Pseudomonadota bacterium]